jgi:hypothetical protein
MDTEQAAALRKPFPPAAIGKLPRGGIMLDYVGHAATTDRLLQVDPTWSWEPLALDERGLPALDGGGNLWIRLTVAGVTRIGVGDGKSAKECIGDAIRNAAMRFGVALDLWAKEDLHAMEQERDEDGAPAPDVAPTRRMSLTITDAQMSKMHASFNELGITDKEQRLAYTVDVIGREVASSKELSKAEASRLLDRLQHDIEQPFPKEPTA